MKKYQWISVGIILLLIIGVVNLMSSKYDKWVLYRNVNPYGEKTISSKVDKAAIEDVINSIGPEYNYDSDFTKVGGNFTLQIIGNETQVNYIFFAKDVRYTEVVGDEIVIEKWYVVEEGVLDRIQEIFDEVIQSDSHQILMYEQASLYFDKGGYYV